MTFIYSRSYRGPLQAIIFDWAGTVLDYGCMAPAAVFMDVFARKGVPITMDEARGPMGAHKRTHIQDITRMPAVAERWRKKHGRAPTERDVDAMYADFIPLQVACLSRYSKLIPGTLKAVEACRRRGMKIGTTTGYDAAMTAVNLKDAAKQGFEPDHTVSASDVPQASTQPGPIIHAPGVIIPSTANQAMNRR